MEIIYCLARSDWNDAPCKGKCGIKGGQTESVSNLPTPLGYLLTLMLCNPATHGKQHNPSFRLIHSASLTIWFSNSMAEDDLLFGGEGSKRALDELVSLALAYRSGTDFKDLLDFSRRFSHLAPYNTMLLHMQNSGLCYTLTARGWRKAFGRRVKPGARSYVILRMMGPVSFHFDVSDTEPIDPQSDRVPAVVSNPFPANGQPPEDALPHIIEACRQLRIVIEGRDFGSTLAGQAQSFDQRAYDFHICLNMKHTLAQKLGTLAHELAHIFCGHLPKKPENAWWEPRLNLPLDAREFEAEAVAYLVTSRMSLDIGSAKYLSGYLSRETLPNYSLESVLTSAGKIETMAAGKFKLKKK